MHQHLAFYTLPSEASGRLPMTRVHHLRAQIVVGAGLLRLHSTSDLLIKPAALDKLGLVQTVSLLLQHEHDVIVGLCRLFYLLYASGVTGFFCFT